MSWREKTLGEVWAGFQFVMLVMGFPLLGIAVLLFCGYAIGRMR